jgi:DNA-binding LacI/PurR family transcriptional regulator
MATLKEVAKRASVSTATVSRVLSNLSYVSADTRARVMAAVAELNYTPNLAARALSKGRTYIIGIIFPYNYDLLFYDPFMLGVLQGIETICTEQGYNLIFSTPRPPVAQSEAFLRLMGAGYLDGAITFESLPDERLNDLVIENGYPCISIGSQADQRPVNTVDVDDFAGAYQIAAYLIALGHREFGIVGFPTHQLTSAPRRLAGYRAAFEDAQLDFKRVPVVNGVFSIQSGYEEAGHLLTMTRPTAILCMNDRMAMGVIQRLQAEGLDVPRDVTVVGFDDIPGAAYFAPPLTTVRQPAHQLGESAIRMLFQWIDRKDRQSPPRFDPLIYPLEVVIRESAVAPQR